MNGRSGIYGMCLLAGLLCLLSTAFAAPGPSPFRQSPPTQADSTMDLLTAVLVAEGAGDSATLASYTVRLRAVYSELDSHVPSAASAYNRAGAVFNRLHVSALATYRDDATLRETLDSGVYNCASAMLLLYGAMRHSGLPLTVYATPAHVFATLDLPERTVRIEVTRPRGGFDFGDDLPEIIDHLADYRYITREDVETLGAEQIYRLFFSTANRITEQQFLAIAYNNIGVRHWNNRQYRETMEAFEQAVLLHPDSRKYRDAYQSSLHLVLQEYEANRQFDAIERLLNHSARLMRNDTLFVYYLLGTARTVIAHYSDTDTGLHRSRAFLDTLAHVVPRDSAITALLSEQQHIVNYNLTVYDYNRGDYEGAYYSSTHLLAHDTDAATRTLHLKSAAAFALALAARERAADAYVLLDSLIPRYHEHPVFRDAYRRVTIDYVLQSGLVRRDGAIADDLLQARDLLLNVYSLDSSNIYLRGIIAAVHHEMGMIELRARHYTAAAEILRIGLQYDPDNEYLRESLRLIEEQQQRTPPPAVNGLARADSTAPAPTVVFAASVNRQRKPVDRRSAVFLYEQHIYVHATWRHLVPDSTYIVTFRQLDARGEQIAINEVYYTPVLTDNIVWSKFALPASYPHDSMTFEILLGGVRAYTRTLRVLR